jgi:hypothetical protein
MFARRPRDVPKDTPTISPLELKISTTTKILFRGGKGEGAVSSNPEELNQKGLFFE